MWCNASSCWRVWRGVVYCEQLVEGGEGCGEIASSWWRVWRGVVYCEQLLEGVRYTLFV